MKRGDRKGREQLGYLLEYLLKLDATLTMAKWSTSAHILSQHIFVSKKETLKSHLSFSVVIQKTLSYFQKLQEG